MTHRQTQLIARVVGGAYPYSQRVPLCALLLLAGRLIQIMKLYSYFELYFAIILFNHLIENVTIVF